MKTYEVTLTITTNKGDPAQWDWQALTGEPVKVAGQSVRAPYRNRDTERTLIISSLNAMQRPLTTSELVKLTGLTPAMTARLVFELKKKRHIREVASVNGVMTYAVA
jgi:hypothetical protein